jgi:RimJ/RimL family protein N-acetyltransferase
VAQGFERTKFEGEGHPLSFFIVSLIDFVAGLKPMKGKGRPDGGGRVMFARTERLLLRPGWVEDAPALLTAIGDERIVRNLARPPWPYRLADAEAFLARESAADAPMCLVFLRDAGAPRLIGGIGFGPKTDDGREFGYWIAKPYWGRGFATEAGRAVIANARHSLRIDRLDAGHFLDNPASGRVLAKLGFRPTGITRMRHCAARNAEVPCREFALELGEGERGDAVAAPVQVCTLAA